MIKYYIEEKVDFMISNLPNHVAIILDGNGRWAKKRLMPRGFLLGPYLPIFGLGALLITFVLTPYDKDILILFIVSCFLGSTLEYITSYIMEKVFKTRWWDYSHDKFNLNGRVCLRATISFGILGILLIKVLNPLLLKLLNFIPGIILTVLTIILGVIFITDLIISLKIISNIKIVNRQHIDSTEEITKKVKEVLSHKSIFSKRLIKAFPDLTIRSSKKKV